MDRGRARAGRPEPSQWLHAATGIRADKRRICEALQALGLPRDVVSVRTRLSDAQWARDYALGGAAPREHRGKDKRASLVVERGPWKVRRSSGGQRTT